MRAEICIGRWNFQIINKIISCLSTNHQGDCDACLLTHSISLPCEIPLEVKLTQANAKTLRRSVTSISGNPKSFQSWITQAKSARRRSRSTGSPGVRNRRTLPPVIPKCVFSSASFLRFSLSFIISFTIYYNVIV